MASEGDSMLSAAAALELDARIRAAIAAGDAGAAVTAALRSLGPEVLGYLYGVLRNEADADEVFAAVSRRLWVSLSSFEWRCSLRTWMYVIARREAERFRRGARRHIAGRVPMSDVADVIAAVKTETKSWLRTEKKEKLARLRDELSVEDRELLVLRVDRGLAWDDIALAFSSDTDAQAATDETTKREAARLRKRFQLLKKKLVARARQEGLVGES